MWAKDPTMGAKKLRFLILFAVLQYTSATSAQFAPTNYEGLKKFIQNNRFTCFDEVLKSMRPEDRSTYSLVYGSRSKSFSIEKPRVILATKKKSSGRFTLYAFGIDPKADSYNSVEVIEFAPEDARFNFHEIIFDEAKAAEPIFVDRPSRCESCHNGLPIWDNYPSWPGFFGSQKHLVKTEENLALKKILSRHEKTERLRSLVRPTRTRTEREYIFPMEEGDWKYHHFSTMNMKIGDQLGLSHMHWLMFRLREARANHEIFDLFAAAQWLRVTSDPSAFLREFPGARTEVRMHDLRRRFDFYRMHAEKRRQEFRSEDLARIWKPHSYQLQSLNDEGIRETFYSAAVSTSLEVLGLSPEQFKLGLTFGRNIPFVFGALNLEDILRHLRNLEDRQCGNKIAELGDIASTRGSVR